MAAADRFVVFYAIFLAIVLFAPSYWGWRKLAAFAVSKTRKPNKERLNDIEEYVGFFGAITTSAFLLIILLNL